MAFIEKHLIEPFHRLMASPQMTAFRKQLREDVNEFLGIQG